MSHTHDEMPGDPPRPNGPKPPSSPAHRDLAARHLVVAQELADARIRLDDRAQRIKALEAKLEQGARDYCALRDKADAMHNDLCRAREDCARIVEKHYRRVPHCLTHEASVALRECAAEIRRAALLPAHGGGAGEGGES